PVREAILTPANVERARQRVRAACDAIDHPSSKARALVDDVASGRAFFGAERFLPAFCELVPLMSYLPGDGPVVLEDPPALTSPLRDEVGRDAADEAQKAKEPHFALRAFYESEASVAGWLRARPAIALSRSGVSGGEAAPESLESFEI